MTARNVEQIVQELAPIYDADIPDRYDDPRAQALFAAIVAEQPVERIVRPSRAPGRWRVSLVVSVAAVAALVSTLVLVNPFSQPQASSAAATAVALKTTTGSAIEGRVPNDAIHHGVIDWSKVPPYIPFYSGRR